MIYHQYQLKPNSFPHRTHRVNKGQMSVIGLNDVLNSSYKEQVRGKLKSSVIHHLNHKLKSDKSQG